MKASMAKKTLAAVAGTAMLMMSLFSMTAAASVDDRVYLRGENLLANPGFEETTDPNTNEGCPFSGWYFDSVTESSWSTLFPDGPSRSGATAAATWCDKPFEMTVSQDVDVSEAGTYEAAVWVSLGYASFGETVLRVTKDGEVVKQTTIPAAGNNTDASYRQIHLKDIELEAGAYVFELVIDCTGIGSNSFARIDDAFLGIQKLEPEPPASAEPVELLTNGGFEGGSFEPWETTAATGIIGPGEGEAHGGTGAVVTWGGTTPFTLTASQSITVDETGTVEGSAWVALGYADFDAVELRVKDADDEVVAQGSLPAVSGNTNADYREIVLEETALEAGSYTVEVCVPCTAGTDAWARIDDVSLILTPDPAQEIPGGDVEELENHVTNGSFEEVDEDGFVGWTYEATNGATTFATDPRTGEKALGAWGDKDYNLTVSQTITLEEAGDYMVSIWVASGFAAYPNTELRVLQNDELVASGRRFAVSARNDMTDYLRAVVPVAALEAGEVTIELSVDCIVEGLEVNEGEEIDGYIRVDDAAMVKLADVTVDDNPNDNPGDDTGDDTDPGGNTGDNTGNDTEPGDNTGNTDNDNTDGNTDDTGVQESPDTGVASAMPIVLLAALSIAVVAATRKARA